jgi:hypothetical protein
MKILYVICLWFIAGHLSGQILKAVNDTIDLIPGVPKTVYLLANDTIPAGDSINVKGGNLFPGNMVKNTWKNKGWFTYVAPQWGFNGKVEGTYTVTDVTIVKTSVARIVFRIHDHSYDSLTINNIAAKFNASGLNFVLFFADPNTQNGFIVPKGSGKKTIFDNSPWIGGMDQDSNLYVSGERYRQGNQLVAGIKNDYYAGPVMDSANYSIYQDTLWNYIWNLKKTDVEYHKNHWQDAGYQPIHDILTWPGNGNVNLGEAPQLAPFFDRNQDGLYDPMNGDYPQIRGDQALFFIFNENRGPHLETGGTRTMKAEFHAMAYGWNMPEDSAFKNTLFINYKIFNRSQRTYFDTYLGTFTDIDLGYPMDDLVGCDVYRGSYFGYNGKAADGDGQANSYGTHPPAQSVTILAGPKLDPAGSDRPRLDDGGHQLCNESINGTGFGDGIPDNERTGLSHFIYYSSIASSPSYMRQPTNFHDYYNYLTGRWIDSTNLIYGGLGHEGYGSYGPPCRFMFPGESDTLNWGAGCVAPNGQKNWTALTAGVLPGDVNGFGSVGPFTFRPGEMKELDLAFVYARDYTSSDTLASLTKLRQMIDIVRNAFNTNKLSDGQSFTKIPELSGHQKPTWKIYPNPAGNLANIIFSTTQDEKTTMLLFDYQGKLLQSKIVERGTKETRFDLSGLPTGLYLVVIISPHSATTNKLVVIR